MVCDICGKAGVRQRYVSRSYEKDAGQIIDRLPFIDMAN